MIFLLLSEDLRGGLQMQNDINEPAWLIVARGSITTPVVLLLSILAICREHLMVIAYISDEHNVCRFVCPAFCVCANRIYFLKL